MRFIDRDQELEALRATQRRSARQSQFTLVPGRRRMGKTTPVREFFRGVPRALSFFVTRKRAEDLRFDAAQDTPFTKARYGVFTIGRVSPTIRAEAKALDIALWEL